MTTGNQMGHPGVAVLGRRTPTIPAATPAPGRLPWQHRLLVCAAAVVALTIGVGACLALPKTDQSTAGRAGATPSSAGPGSAAPWQHPQTFPTTVSAASPENGAPGGVGGGPRRSAVPSSSASPLSTGGLAVTQLKLADVDASAKRPLKVRVRVTITATSTASFTMNLHHEGSGDQKLGGADTVNPTDIPVPVSGALDYQRTVELDVTARECRQRFILVAVSTSPPALNIPPIGVKQDPRCEPDPTRDDKPHGPGDAPDKGPGAGTNGVPADAPSGSTGDGTSGGSGDLTDSGSGDPPAPGTGDRTGLSGGSTVRHVGELGGRRIDVDV